METMRISDVSNGEEQSSIYRLIFHKENFFGFKEKKMIHDSI